MELIMLLLKRYIRYKIKEHRRHGEAASVNLQVVKAEQVRVQEILAKFAPRDCWNFDKTALFAFAPPDWGLASKQMRGKKKHQFQVILGFTCNADGSEKLPIFYIGKSQKSQCFKKHTAEEWGFYYCNNKKAWMTSNLFEE
jgi:DDE superfamily endonuclease